jgi:hypothetical protein
LFPGGEPREPRVAKKATRESWHFAGRGATVREKVASDDLG